jgi:hypothetical protein
VSSRESGRECVARLPHEEVKVLRCMYLDPHGTISVRSWNTTAQSIHSGRAGYIRSLRGVRLRTDPLRDFMPRVTLRYELRRDSSVKVVRRNRVADLTSVVGVTIE